MTVSMGEKRVWMEVQDLMGGWMDGWKLKASEKRR